MYNKYKLGPCNFCISKNSQSKILNIFSFTSKKPVKTLVFQNKKVKILTIVTIIWFDFFLKLKQDRNLKFQRSTLKGS